MEQIHDATLTIRLPREMYDALKALAEEDERPVAQIVRRAAREYLRAHANDRLDRPRS